MPPEEGVHLAPAPRADGAAAGSAEHFLADVLDPEAELNVDVGARLTEIRRLYEFTLHPGRPCMRACSHARRHTCTARSWRHVPCQRA